MTWPMADMECDNDGDSDSDSDSNEPRIRMADRIGANSNKGMLADRWQTDHSCIKWFQGWAGMPPTGTVRGVNTKRHAAPGTCG